MEVEIVSKKSSSVDVSVIKARETLIEKMEKALKKEKEIGEQDDKRREEKSGEAYGKLKKKGYVVPTSEYIRNYFGKAPYVDDKMSLSRFVKGVDKVYKNQFNIKLLEQMIANAKNYVKQEKEQNRMAKKVQKSERKIISLIYRNGTIRPKKNLSEVEAKKYHWEIKTKYQPWGKLNGKNSRPNIREGLIRLHCNGNECISNVVDIETVVRRQAFTAKRQQFRFQKTDSEFKQRCQGVAQRILRLTTPHIIRHGLANGFSMRIFQDRVSRLPQHLDKNVQEILKLCQTKLSNRSKVTPGEADYIKMVEFCEPTIHLNPAGMRRELTDIKLGKKIKLQMYEDNKVESDNSSSEDSSLSSSEDSSSSSEEEEEEEEEEESLEEEEDDIGVDYAADLTKMKMDELKQMASDLGLSVDDVAEFGKRTLRATYIDAILASLKKEEEAAELSSAEEENSSADSSEEETSLEKESSSSSEEGKEEFDSEYASDTSSAYIPSDGESVASSGPISDFDDENGEEEEQDSSEEEQDSAQEEQDSAQEEQEWVPASKRPNEGTQVQIKNQIGILVHNGGWNELDGTDIRVNGWANGKVQVQSTEKENAAEEQYITSDGESVASNNDGPEDVEEDGTDASDNEDAMVSDGISGPNSDFDDENGEEEEPDSSEEEQDSPQEEQEWVPASERPGDGTQVRIKNQIGILVHNGGWNELDGTDIRVNGWANGKVQVRTTEKESSAEEQYSSEEEPQEEKESSAEEQYSSEEEPQEEKESSAEEQYSSEEEPQEEKEWVPASKRPNEGTQVQIKNQIGILVHNGGWNELDGTDIRVNGWANGKVQVQSTEKESSAEEQYSSEEEPQEEKENAVEEEQYSSEEEQDSAQEEKENAAEEEQYSSEEEQDSAQEEQEWVPASKRPNEGTQVQIKNQVGILVHNGGWNELDGTDIRVNGWANGKVQVQSSRNPLLMLDSSADEEDDVNKKTSSRNPLPMLDSSADEEDDVTKTNDLMMLVPSDEDNDRIESEHGWRWLTKDDERPKNGVQIKMKGPNGHMHRGHMHRGDPAKGSNPKSSHNYLVDARGTVIKVNNKTIHTNGYINKIQVPVDVSRKSTVPKSSNIAPGELSTMLMNMSDDWATSDDELFAEDSSNEFQFNYTGTSAMTFADSSSDHDDTHMTFAPESSTSTNEKTSSDMEFAATSSDMGTSEMSFAGTSDSDQGHL